MFTAPGQTIPDTRVDLPQVRAFRLAGAYALLLAGLAAHDLGWRETGQSAYPIGNSHRWHYSGDRRLV
jgi:hypothetical protein